MIDIEKVVVLKNDEMILKYEKHFCQNLKKLRTQRNMNIWEFAAVSGLSIRDIERMEEGIMSKDMDLHCVFYIARYFGVSPNKLFEESLF